MSSVDVFQARCSIVKRNQEGVAGFFEDLPVLLFVLMGVMVLVASATWVSQERASANLESELEEIARDITKALLRSIAWQHGSVPRLSSVSGMDTVSVAEEVAQLRSFAVTVASLHPEIVTVATVTRGEPSAATSTGFARLLFNALDDAGLVCLLEVRAVVW